jgi:hypothetical protein
MLLRNETGLLPSVSPHTTDWRVIVNFASQLLHKHFRTENKKPEVSLASFFCHLLRN